MCWCFAYMQICVPPICLVPMEGSIKPMRTKVNKPQLRAATWVPEIKPGSSALPTELSLWFPAYMLDNISKLITEKLSKGKTKKTVLPTSFLYPLWGHNVRGLCQPRPFLWKSAVWGNTESYSMYWRGVLLARAPSLRKTIYSRLCTNMDIYNVRRDKPKMANSEKIMVISADCTVEYFTLSKMFSNKIQREDLCSKRKM